MTPSTLTSDSADYPVALLNPAAPFARLRLDVIGDPVLLRHRLLALVSSVRCPGDAIGRLYDLIRKLRDAGVPVIGGFHSPMEKECLDLLLRGRQPIVVCPARHIGTMRVPRVWRPAIAEGRLLVLSPFEARHSRVTGELAEQRNRLVCAMAAGVLVGHAEAGGRVEAEVQRAGAAGTPVFDGRDGDLGAIVAAIESSRRR